MNRTAEVTVILTKTITVEIDEDEVIVEDWGYEYCPDEEDGRGEIWEVVNYDNVDWKKAVRATEMIPAGWEIEDIKIN